MSFFGGRRQTESTTSLSAQRPDAPQPQTAPPSPVGFETVLGTNSTMEGTLRSGANIRLDGTFTGTLDVTGNVLVGETAKINADVHARNVSIAGAVRGNISGKKVQILRTGRVWGDIHATALTTEEGAFIDGKITMVSPENAQPLPEETGSEPQEAPVGSSQPEDYDRMVDETADDSMGAVEGDLDEMNAHSVGQAAPDAPLVDNISAEVADELPAQTDSPEGQRRADYQTDDSADDIKQST